MSTNESSLPSSESDERRRSGWILDPSRDLLLFVATPLLIVPLAWAARQRYSGEQILTLVLAFGALGHHMPGLMRAYGDRELFRRFRTRFLLVPLVLLPICGLFFVDQLVGMRLVVLVWGIWHFLMQTYGFARIYDAKIGQVDALSRRTDWLLCVGWFGMAILHSPRRIGEFLGMAYQAGLPTEWGLPLEEARMAWTVATIAITVWGLSRWCWRALQGLPVSSAKVALLVISFGFFWFCTAQLSNLVLGVAMFEVFHDVQYLAIVWVFNRNRVKSGANVGSLSRFLFRNSGALMGLYLGVIFAYGSLSLVVDRVSTEILRNLLYGIIATSNILHFYYDGFIWKVRDPATRKSLGVGGRETVDPSSTESRRGLWREARHWLWWGGLAMAVMVLYFTETRQARSALESQRRSVKMAAAVVEAVPDSVSGRNELARTLINENKFREAFHQATAAVKLSPGVYKSYVYRGVAQIQLGESEAGLQDLVRAERLHANDAYLQYHLAMAKIRLGRRADAVRHLEASRDLHPGDARVHYNLGLIVFFESIDSSDRVGFTRARQHFREASRQDPQHALAACMQGEVERQLGNSEGALPHFQRSLALDSSLADAHHGRALALRNLSRFDDANAALSTATILAVRQSPGRPDLSGKALEWAEELRDRSKRDDLQSWELLGMAHAANQQWEAALEACERCLVGAASDPRLEKRVQKQRAAYRRRTLPAGADLQPLPTSGSATNR